MRTFIFLFFLIFYSVGLIGQFETEPNDILDEADVISLNQTYFAYIDTIGDDDYFKFLISEPGMLHVEVIKSPSNIGLLSYILNHPNKDSVVHRNFNAKDGDLFEMWLSVCDLGDYYLFFSDRGLGSSGGPNFNENETYGFEISYTPFVLTDPCECDNEKLNQACPINFGINNSALINPWYKFPSAHNTPTRDLDFYTFNITEPSRVNLQVTQVPDNIELEYFFFDQSGERFYYDYTIENGESYNIWATFCEVGQYYLLFRDGARPQTNGGSDFNPNVPYHFRLERFSALSFDGFECNNSISSSRPIELCETIEASIDPWFEKDDSGNTVTKDYDFYNLAFEANTTVNFTVDSIPNNLEMCIAVFDSNIDQIKSMSTDNRSSYSDYFTTKEAGVYYIRVSSCNSSYNLAEKYSMTVGCNLISSNIEISESQFKISPNPSNQGYIEIEGLTRVETDIEIYSFEGQRVMHKTHQGVENLLDISLLNDGFYFVKITGDKGKAEVHKILVQ